MKRKTLLAISIVIFSLCTISFVFFTPLNHKILDILTANKEHYLTCNELPDKTQVEEIFQKHNETIQQIKNLYPDRIEISVNTYNSNSSFNNRKLNCPEKADIIILLQTNEQRKKIEEILGKDFFGIPYRIINM
jgi:hypothetical protein